MDDQTFDKVVSMCMKYMTQEVLLNHAQYGVGRVVAIRHDLMTIKFSNKVFKDFKFPDAIGRYLFPVENVRPTISTKHNATAQQSQKTPLPKAVQEKRERALQRRKARMVRGGATVSYKAAVEQNEKERIAEAKQRMYSSDSENSTVHEGSQQTSITKKVQYKLCPKCGLNSIPIDEEFCSVCQPHKIRATDYPTYTPPRYAPPPETIGYSTEDLDYEYELFWDEVREETTDYADSMARSEDDGWYYADDETDYKF